MNEVKTKRKYVRKSLVETKHEVWVSNKLNAWNAELNDVDEEILNYDILSFQEIYEKLEKGHMHLYWLKNRKARLEGFIAKHKK